MKFFGDNCCICQNDPAANESRSDKGNNSCQSINLIVTQLLSNCYSL